MYQIPNVNIPISSSIEENVNNIKQQHLQQQQQQYAISNNDTLNQPQQHYEQSQLHQQQFQHDQYFVNDGLFENNDGTASFSLDEIGAIINSKEFEGISKDLQIINQTAQQGYLATLNTNTNLNIFAQLDNNTTNQDCNHTVDDHQIRSDIPKQPRELSHDTTNIKVNGRTNNSPDQRASNMEGSTKNEFSNNNHMAGVVNNKPSKPYVEIIEQPAKCALRFRYKCEGRSAGSLPGTNSSPESKTFPSIRIANYVGKAVVVISCVTKDAPYQAHPHNIVGKEGCKKGICTIVINNEANTIKSFSSLGIQCVKRKDIEESLSLRESINVDPFRNGFSHKLSASNIDLNVVRLCFQVFIEGSTPNKFNVPLTPVVSEPIHDKKAMSDLVITKLSHCSAPATGGREIILLCDRISKDDIQVRFYEEREGKVIWETYVDLAPTDVHKQVAICFKTPKYHNENIAQPVMVRIQLKRVSDNQVSEPRVFQFLPCESDEDIISRKRQKIEWVNMNHNILDNILKPNHQQPSNQNPFHFQHQTHQQHHNQQQQPTTQQQQQGSQICMAPYTQPELLLDNSSLMTQRSFN